MDVRAVIEYWKRSSREDLKTARSLFKTRRYAHCLFFCHLTLEKILKALVVRRTSRHAPFVHKLARLAADTGIAFDENQKDLLDEVTAFNVEARYNDFKFTLQKKATRRYVEGYLKRCAWMHRWLAGEL